MSFKDIKGASTFGGVIVNLLVAAIKPYKCDAIVDELMGLNIAEIRIFDYKGYKPGDANEAKLRGAGQLKASPKIQLEILADNDELREAYSMIKRHLDQEKSDTESIYVVGARAL